MPIIDNNCTARILAAGGGYIYWLDNNSTKLRRSDNAGGSLPTSQVSVVDNNCTAISLSVEGNDIYWIDPNGQFYLGRVNGGQLQTVATLGTNFGGFQVGAGGGTVFLRSGSNLSRAMILNNVLQPWYLVDNNFTAITWDADNNFVFWSDPNGSYHVGTVVNGQLASNVISQPGAFFPQLLAAGNGRTYYKYGNNLWMS
jgi:hypothetical protein